eukprot:m.123494 g.123494  ORF g.123494 m.123494 type:complete len:51 (-) comp12949_c0_seq2:1123-1275(-)
MSFTTSIVITASTAPAAVFAFNQNVIKQWNQWNITHNTTCRHEQRGEKED